MPNEEQKKKKSGSSSSKDSKQNSGNSKRKRKPSQKLAIEKAKTIEVILYEDLRNFEPRTSFERIQCAVNPSHEMTIDDLTDQEQAKLNQYHFIYQQLIYKDANQLRLSDIIPQILAQLQITKGQFWLRLANAKKLFAYEGKVDYKMKKAIHLEQAKALYEELHTDYREDKDPKMVGSLLILFKYIGELETGGASEEGRIEQAIEDLQFPEVQIIAPDETPLSLPTKDEDYVDFTESETERTS